MLYDFFEQPTFCVCECVLFSDFRAVVGGVNMEARSYQ